MKTITVNALMKRLGRNLAKDGLILKTAKGETASLGPFYTVNESNAVEHRNLDWDTLLMWAKDAGLFKAEEIIAA